MRLRYTKKTLIREIAFVLLGLAFCVPFYLLFALALKSDQAALSEPFGFPGDPKFSNFSEAWSGQAGTTMSEAMISSLIITVCSVIVLVALGSICAYAIVRRPGKASAFFYFLMVLGIIMPFQLGIVPLYALFRHLGIIGSYFSMIILWIGIFLPLTVFLYSGFMRTLPRDYEEAAQVDGASVMRTYRKVVFPLLRPVTGTVAILTGLFIWNDFFISVIFLTGTENVTLPVKVYTFIGEYFTRYNLVFASVAIALLPVMIFFVFAQRQLIKGFSSGVRG